MTQLRRRRGRLLAAELLLVVIAAVVVVVVATSSGPAPRSGAVPARPFAPDSVWNEPLPTDAPIAASSATYVNDLQQQLRARGAWINTTPYSIPVYTVGPDEPRVPVTLDQHGTGSVAELARVFAAGVPIPADAHAAAGTDQSMVVWQPSRDVLWEFWRAHRVGGAWHALWGGEMTHVSRSPGYYTDPADWGGSASSLSILGGLMTIAELRSGRIDHALALAIPDAAAGRFVYPAQRTDGHDPSSSAIPEGTRFRLDPRLDIQSLHLPRVTEMIAFAAQRYGMIVRDQSGSVSLYAQDPTPTGADPYTGANGLFSGLAPDALLRGFPWSRLEVVSPRWNRR